jgi:hypothetical protein
VRVDGTAVGDGRVGRVTRSLSDVFLAHVQSLKEAAAAVR